MALYLRAMPLTPTVAEMSCPPAGCTLLVSLQFSPVGLCSACTTELSGSLTKMTFSTRGADAPLLLQLPLTSLLPLLRLRLPCSPLTSMPMECPWRFWYSSYSLARNSQPAYRPRLAGHELALSWPGGYASSVENTPSRPGTSSLGSTSTRLALKCAASPRGSVHQGSESHWPS